MEYSEYLTKVHPNLLDITYYNPIIGKKCLAEKILGKFDVARLEAEPNSITRNSIFWDIIARKSKCWLKLIEIFRAENDQSVADVLLNGKRDRDKLNFYNFEKFDVVVKRERVTPGEQKHFGDDRYVFDKGVIAGLALVINITEFDDEDKNRAGAEEDFRYMKSLWPELGYNVTSYQGSFTKKEVNIIVEEFLDACAANQAQSSVVFIGSHGQKGNISMSDGTTQIQVYEDIIKEFNNNLTLEGKPKLFFIQSCQHFPKGNDTQAKVRSELKDTLVSFSTLPGEPANRHEELGSYYVYALTRVFMKNAYNMEIKTMLSDVAQEMIDAQEGIQGKTQVPCFEISDNMRPFYFRPTTLK